MIQYPTNFPELTEIFFFLGLFSLMDFSFKEPLISFFLIINGILSTVLILNQNESAKDSTSNQSSNSSGFSTNPLESLTWICLGFEFILLLINTKVTDF